MSKKDKITITREDEFTEIDSELAEAMSLLEETNARIETMLQEHAKPETQGEDVPEQPDNADVSPEPGHNA